jgi:hypothetical protein
MGEHSTLFYLLILFLGVGVLFSLGVGFLFFFKQSGVKRANHFYGALLILFGLTLLHNILLVSGFFERYPQWRFLPLYFTLAFPTLLFYHVKLNLYPAYRLRSSDIKHFLLPGLQLLFFIGMSFTPASYRSQFDRHFYNPFFGAFEQFIYLSAFFAYLYFAYRYVRRKRASPERRKEARRLLFYLSSLLKGFFLLFCVHAVFVVADFISYEFFNLNLRAVKPYAGLGILSFAALLFWLNVYGVQVLIWGRKLLKS